jgi:beta-mannosidase
VYDRPEPARGLLRWDLFHADGRLLLAGLKAVRLRYGESARQKTLKLAPLLAQHGAENLILRIALDLDGRCVSEDSVFLAPPRFVALTPAQTGVDLRLTDRTHATLMFTSSAFQHRFAFDFAGIAFRCGDNYFELFPRELKRVDVEFSQPQTLARLRRALTHRSLADTY